MRQKLRTISERGREREREKERKRLRGIQRERYTDYGGNKKGEREWKKKGIREKEKRKRERKK
jgi:hypothetical protein